MKFVHFTSFLLLASHCLAEIDWSNVDRCDELEQLKIWRDSRTEEGMNRLISVAMDESVPIEIRAVATIDLNEGYVPSGEMWAWGGGELMEEADLVAFVLASSSDDHVRWLEYSQTVASERRTHQYFIRIYLNEASCWQGARIIELDEEERQNLVQNRLNEFKPNAALERIECDTTPDGIMIAYGYYTDEKGDERVIAVLDSERYRKDRKIEPGGVDNACGASAL